jgi:hypothetical protein
MANKFLTKEGKFVTKGGKFVTVEPPDPKDCICCGGGGEKECTTDADCPDAFLLDGSDPTNTCQLPDLPQYFKTYKEAEDAGLAILADCPSVVLSIDNANQYCCDGKCQPKPCVGDCPGVTCRWVWKYKATDWELVKNSDSEFCEGFGCQCEKPGYDLRPPGEEYLGGDFFENTNCGKPNNGIGPNPLP